MTVLILLFIASLFLAYSNGANDNFKGVATLFGSHTTNYRKALAWATVTTFGGSLASIFMAEKLIAVFSGKGIVPDSLVASPEFLLAVALGAGGTVILATIVGFPISTTHSLVGALMGGGLASGADLQFAAAGQKFFAPLLISPIVAIALAGGAYIFFRYFRLKMGITKDYCACVGETEEVIATSLPARTLTLKQSIRYSPTILRQEECIERYSGRFLGLQLERILDFFHFVSAGVVSFARGLNDTPKIVALLLVSNALEIKSGLFVIGLAMAIGGLLNAKKVAMVMSRDITPLNHGQGFTANLVTGFLVIVASRLGMPVSTTHVSVGSLFGIGLATGERNSSVIRNIVLSWVLTLPIAAALAAIVMILL